MKTKNFYQNLSIIFVLGMVLATIVAYYALESGMELIKNCAVIVMIVLALSQLLFVSKIYNQ